MFVSRQLGHANPSITLGVYAHLFDKAQHAKELRTRLEASNGNIMGTAAGDWWRTDAGEQLALDAEIAPVVPIRSAVANGG